MEENEIQTTELFYTTELFNGTTFYNSELLTLKSSKLTDNLTFKVMDSRFQETVVIAATVSFVGVVLLATLYGMYIFVRQKRRMVMAVTSPSTITVPIPDYFTRPKEPMLFLNELSRHVINQEPVSYWQRPIQPVKTDNDLYSYVTS